MNFLEIGKNSKFCIMRIRIWSLLLCPVAYLYTNCNSVHIPMYHLANGLYTLPWAQIGGWANIRAINIVYLNAQGSANSA